MGYQVKEISLEEAKRKAEQYVYGLVYLLDEVLLGKIETIKEKICWEDCIEARFFSEQGELHIFDYNGEERAVCVEETEETESYQSSLERTYPLAEKFGKQRFHTFQVKEYLGCDEDGQVTVLLTRLVGLK